MNQDFKYIYFEICWTTGDRTTSPYIENWNILLIKPQTNSDGIWGCRHMTQIYPTSRPLTKVVDQVWIDFNKYTPNDMHNKTHHIVQSPLSFDEWVQEVLKKLNVALRENKINSLTKD